MLVPVIDSASDFGATRSGGFFITDTIRSEICKDGRILRLGWH